MNKGKRYGGGRAKYLLDARGNQMFSSELLPLLGLQATGPIPKAFSGEFVVQGVTIRVKAAHGHMGRRVFAVCPDCQLEVCAGHLHQHTQARHALGGTL